MELGIQRAFDLLTQKLSSWVTTAIKLIPNLVAAILILLVFYGIGWLIRKGVSKSLRKITKNQAVVNLLETIAGIIVLAAGFFIALGVLQLEGAVTSLLAGVGVIGLALGFAFQGTAANFISGIILSVRHPFDIGDIIESRDFYGYVHTINLRCTIIRTTQGQLVYIPNRDLLENPFLNYTWNHERRIDLECGVAYGDDLDLVEEVGLKAIKTLDVVKTNRPVELVFKELSGSSINFDLRFWIHFEKNYDYKKAKSDAIKALKKAFEENDIDIAWPVRSIEFGVKGGKNLGDVLSEQIALFQANGSDK